MQDIVSEDLHKNPKRFWSYIKSRKQESSGITSLKIKDGYLHSDTVSKADILNKQFHSVYTKDDYTNMPDKGPSPYPSMMKIRSMMELWTMCSNSLHAIEVSDNVGFLPVVWYQSAV
jgi:hypothetical protein